MKPAAPTPKLSKKNKWWISTHSFYAAYHFAMKYGEWKDEYRNLENPLSSPGMDGMPHGNGGVSKPTEQAAVKKAELKNKMQLIEDTARETDEQLYNWIMKAVTTEGVTYIYLQNIMRIPCSRNTFYERRRKFYYLLSKKMC